MIKKVKMNMTIGQILNNFYNNLKDTFALKKSLATVATSGSYNDLNDKPEPPVQAQADWNQNNSEAPDYIKNRICYESAPETVVYDILEADMGSGSLIGQDPNYSSCYFFDFPEGFAPKQDVTYTLHAKDKEFSVTWNWNSFPQSVSGYNGGGTIYLNSVPSAEYASYKYYISLSFDGSYYEGSKLTWEATVTTQDTKIVDSKFLPEGIGYDEPEYDVIGHILTWDANGQLEGVSGSYYYFNPTQPILPENTYYIYFPKDDLYVKYSQSGTAESGSGGGSFGQGGGGFTWNLNGIGPNGETAGVSMSGNPYFFKNETAYFVCKTIKQIPVEYTSAAGLKLPNNAEIFNDYTNNKATGNYSHAEGYRTTASRDNSHAEGDSTTAMGTYSHAEGYNTTAIGYASHAEGSTTVSSGNYSHVEGYQTVAGGDYSHAEGYNTGSSTAYNVIKEDSTTLFTTTTINNIYIGSIIKYVSKYYKVTNVQYNSGTRLTITPSIPTEDTASTLYYYLYAAIGNYSHIEGYNTAAIGNYSHAEGQATKANGQSSHAEGGDTTASGNYSHAEGYNNTASGHYSHAEGTQTTASGNYSHAEGVSTIATGATSHAEGSGTTASSYNSHTEGYYTTASGTQSHAEGYYTIANHRSQHTFGEYNIADNSTASTSQKGNYIEIVGNGTADNARSNARTLDWNGNEWVAGTITSQGKRVSLMYSVEDSSQGTISPNVFNNCGVSAIGTITLDSTNEVAGTINDYQGVLVSNGSLTINTNNVPLKSNIDLTSLDANETYLFSIIGNSVLGYFCAINKFA